MREVLHERYPGCEERPLTRATVAKNMGCIFWPSHGTLVPIVDARRVGRCLGLTLADGRSFLADYGSVVYIHSRKGRR